MTWLVIVLMLLLIAGLYRRIEKLEEQVQKLQPPRAYKSETAAPTAPVVQLAPAVHPSAEAQPPQVAHIAPSASIESTPQRTVPDGAVNFEITGARLLAFVGGLLLLGAIGFFVATAISSGLLTERMQIILGYVASAAIAGAGAALLRHRGADVARICVGVGAGGWFMTSVAGSQLYDVLSTPTALAMMAMGVAATVWGALRLDSRLLTGFGLLAGCAAPILVGAAATVGVSAALFVMMAATAVVAVRRDWPSIAIGMLVITAPQLLPLADDGKRAWIVIASLAAWHLLQLAAAAGFDIVHPKEGADLRRSTVSLSLLTTSITAAMLANALDTPAPWILLFGLVQIAAAAVMMATRPRARASGRLILAAGALFLSLAAAERFDGSAVAISWSATALALFVLYCQSTSIWTLLVAAAHAVAAGVHIMVIDFPRAIKGDSFWVVGDALKDASAFVWPWIALALATAACAAAAWRWLDPADVGARLSAWAGAAALAVGAVIALPTLLDAELGWGIAAALIGPGAIAAYEAGARGLDLARALAAAAWSLLVLAALFALGGPLSVQGLADATNNVTAALLATALLTAVPLLIATLAFNTDVALRSHVSALIAVAAVVFLIGSSVLVVASLSPDADAGVSSSASAQTALSSWWALLGLAAVMIGIAQRIAIVHKAGAALLLIAAAKVALIDTSNLESTMRVLALAVVGILLMVGGWIYQRSTDDGRPPA